MSRWRVSQYADGLLIASKVYRSKLWARWIAWLYRGESPLRVRYYTTTLTKEKN